MITDSGSSSYSGGLIGDNCDGEAFGCFWDTETSGKTSGYGGRGLTTTEMKTELFYLNSGWADNGWVNSTLSSAYAYSGGLVGRISSGTISNSYAAGSVSATANSTLASSAYIYSGGLIGSNNYGTFTSCFWDQYTSGNSSAVGSGSSDGIAGKTTMEIQMLSTFTNTGWDFAGEIVNGNSDIWRMCVDGVGYPRLNWEFLQYGDFVCPDGVMFSDFAMLAENWLLVDGDQNFNEAYDFDKNDAVDVNDLIVLCDGWLTEFDFVDFASIAASWDTIKGNPEFNHILDLDDSGTVDSGDLVIFCENWLSVN